MGFKAKEKVAEVVATEPKFITFQLLGNNTQSFKLASTDLVNDPEKGFIRKIRLAHGASTIFVDEMKEFELELPEVALLFFNRTLEISSADRNALAFLRLTDQNADKVGRLPNKKPAVFKEDKPSEKVKMRQDRLDLMNKAENLAKDATDEEMLAFAHILNISTVDIELARVEFTEAARLKPDFFIKYLNDPKNERQFNMNKALKAGVIIVDGGVAKWVETKKQIVEIPADKNPESFLADFAITEDGKAFYEAILKLV